MITLIYLFESVNTVVIFALLFFPFSCLFSAELLPNGGLFMRIKMTFLFEKLASIHQLGEINRSCPFSSHS